jgi:hypothetical protein
MTEDAETARAEYVKKLEEKLSQRIIHDAKLTNQLALEKNKTLGYLMAAETFQRDLHKAESAFIEKDRETAELRNTIAELSKNIQQLTAEVVNLKDECDRWRINEAFERRRAIRLEDLYKSACEISELRRKEIASLKSAPKNLKAHR